MYLSEECVYKGFFPYEPGSPDAMIHNDHLGTPQKMTDSSGAVVWAADYKPFGEATVTVSTITNNLRFPGQYYDAETGLHYNYFRDYNPVIGRYVEADPIGLRGGLNLYAYTNNPIRLTDFFGLLSDQETSDLMTWAGEVSGIANPERVVSTLAGALADPNTPKAAILLAIKKYNLEEYNKTASDPSYDPQTIDPTWAAEHPLDALKKLKDYKTKQCK